MQFNVPVKTKHGITHIQVNLYYNKEKKAVYIYAYPAYHIAQDYTTVELTFCSKQLMEYVDKFDKDKIKILFRLAKDQIKFKNGHAWTVVSDVMKHKDLTLKEDVNL